MRRLIERLGLDGCLAVAFIAVAVGAYVQTLSFPARAATWPQWVLLAFALLSLLVVVMRLVFPERKS